MVSNFCSYILSDNTNTTYIAYEFTDTFTVSQAVNAFGFGKFQAKLSLFTGLCWMADSMEMTILSILSLALHCDWKISRYQQALATTVSPLIFLIVKGLFLLLYCI